MNFLAKAVLLTAGISAIYTMSPVQSMTLQGRAAMFDRAPAVTGIANDSAYKLNAQAGSSPADYEGTWNCISKVVNSNVASIAPGMTTQCRVDFRMKPSGQLLVSWQQDRWNPSQCAVVEFTPTHSTITHKNTMNTGADWIAEAQDWLRMENRNQMHGTSKVIQYKSGRVIGFYETDSVLTRI